MRVTIKQYISYYCNFLSIANTRKHYSRAYGSRQLEPVYAYSNILESPIRALCHRSYVFIHLKIILPQQQVSKQPISIWCWKIHKPLFAHSNIDLSPVAIKINKLLQSHNDPFQGFNDNNYRVYTLLQTES